MTKKQLDALSVLAILARMHGTTLVEEVDKHNADIERRIARGDIHPPVTAEERMARVKAVKRRALDKVKAKRAAARALKPKTSAEEIAAKAVARDERKKASRRRYRVKARDALRTLRKKTGRPAKRKYHKGAAELTAGERRVRKAETDRRYTLATQEALREQRNEPCAERPKPAAAHAEEREAARQALWKQHTRILGRQIVVCRLIVSAQATL